MLLKETCYRHNSRIFGRKRRESPFETDPGGVGGGGESRRVLVSPCHYRSP